MNLNWKAKWSDSRAHQNPSAFQVQNPRPLTLIPLLSSAAAEAMGADRISALPEEIKISILSLVDVKYAIRTSALARSWRHLWTHRPCLYIGTYQDQLGEGSVSVSSDWIERAHHLISSLRGPLLVFKLCHRFRSHQAPLIQRLLDLLLQKGGIETLNLEFICYRLLVHLPPFHSLKVLQLYQCHVLLPTGFQGFRSLTTLELALVEISNDHLHFLIHTSNNLTTFSGTHFVRSQKPLSINISSPLLRHLKFGIDCSIEKVSVISAPCLEQVEIIDWNQDHTDPSSKKLASAALGLLISVAMVSSLDLNFEILKLIHGDSDDSDQINRVVILMEELLGKKRDGISCLNQNLESVTIRTGGIMAAINLGKFFLLNAKVLKLMQFQCWKRSLVEPGRIEELQKAEVTSSDAKVVIFCYNEGVTINVK